MHYIKSIRIFEDGVRSEHALVIQGGSLGGFGLTAWCMQFEECLPSLGCQEYFDQGSSFRLLFLRVDCECNRLFLLVTVFFYASAFNGDLSQWDVAAVTDMGYSKSIRILENIGEYWRMKSILILENIGE
jgi:surface protein